MTQSDLLTALGLLFAEVGMLITVISLIYSKIDINDIKELISSDGKKTRTALNNVQNKLQADYALALEQLSQRLSAYPERAKE